MNTIAIPDESNAIATIDVAEMFDPESSALNDALEQLREQVTSEVFDVTKESGRKDIARLAHKVARTKTAIDGAGKEYVSGLKSQAKKVDVIRKHAREYLDSVKAEVRAPLTRWEDEEKARQEKVEGMFQAMYRLECPVADDGITPLSSGEIRANIDKLRAVDTGMQFGERMAEASLIKNDLLNKMQARADEMEAVEMRQQKEQQARIAAEKEAAARREREIAESARQREREASAQREAEAKRAAEQRERELEQENERLQQEAKAAVERANETARIAKEEQREINGRSIDRRIERDERDGLREIEATDALQSIIDGAGTYLSATLILNEIVAGKVPYVRFVG